MFFFFAFFKCNMSTLKETVLSACQKKKAILSFFFCFGEMVVRKFMKFIQIVFISDIGDSQKTNINSVFLCVSYYVPFFRCL